MLKKARFLLTMKQIIKNSSKNSILSEKALLHTSIFQKAKGLMFSKQKDLIFVEKKLKYIPLHMWFVFYPIDVLFLNENKQVIEIKENFRPFMFYNPLNKAKYVIELKQGAIQESKTTLGDLLQF